MGEKATREKESGTPPFKPPMSSVSGARLRGESAVGVQRDRRAEERIFRVRERCS
jgi:hypothetical protein